MSQPSGDPSISAGLQQSSHSYAHDPRYTSDEGSAMVEMSLHEQLLAAGAGNGLGQSQSIGQVTNAQVQHTHNTHAGSPHEQQHMRQSNISSSSRPLAPHIDPAIGVAYPGGGSNDLSGGEGQRNSAGKRELSKSKRAEQNRAAQRAFRQRKEGYIKKLEEQVAGFQGVHTSHDDYGRLSLDNYRLREYVTILQARLLEVEQSYPPPPPELELRDPRNAQLNQIPPAPMDSSSVSQLQAAAAAAQQSPGYDDRKDVGQSQYPDPLGYPSQRGKAGGATGRGEIEPFEYEASSNNEKQSEGPSS